jgi:hypothetical protein
MLATLGVFIDYKIRSNFQMGASTLVVKLHFFESGYLLKRLCTFQSSTVTTPDKNIELSSTCALDKASVIYK